MAMNPNLPAMAASRKKPVPDTLKSLPKRGGSVGMTTDARPGDDARIASQLGAATTMGERVRNLLPPEGGAGAPRAGAVADAPAVSRQPKNPPPRLNLNQRRASTIDAAYGAGASKDLRSELDDQLRRSADAEGALRAERIKLFQADRNRSGDPMQRAAAMAEFRANIQRLEAERGIQSRREAEIRRATTGNAQDMTPEERAAARDRLVAQFPAARQAIIGDAESGLAGIRDRIEKESQRRSTEMNENYAKFLPAGITPEQAGDIRRTIGPAGPYAENATEQASGDRYQQFRASSNMRGLENLRKMAEGRVAEARSTPTALELGPDMTRQVDTDSLAPLVERARFSEAERSRMRELGRTTTEADIATERARGEMAKAAPQVAVAQAKTQAVRAGTEQTMAEAESLQAQRQAVLQRLGVRPENISSAAENLSNAITSAGSLTTPGEINRVITDSQKNIVEPLRKLAKEDPAQAAIMANEILSTITTDPFSYLEYLTPGGAPTPTTIFRAQVMAMRDALQKIADGGGVQ